MDVVTPPTSRGVSVGFVSLGCAKNRVDSQIMAGVLLAEGVRLAATPEEADVVLVNTCAFIDAARKESTEAIRAACRLKGRGRCRAVLVTGCLPQRYRAALAERLPEVDGFIGVDELESVGAVVRALYDGRRGLVDVSPVARRLFDPRPPGVVFSNGAYAYLRIAEGCDHPCAFCTIPAIRGRYRSRPPDQIVREAERLLDMGFRELDLIAQDTLSYGRDMKGGASLPSLLKALGKIGGRFWIRVLYGYPSGADEELIEAMNAVPQVCPYLDIPIQHSHPDVLRAMRRAGTVARVDGMAERLRRALPGVALRTTCLVGYPGETREHFEHLLDYLRRSAFDHVGVFVYSPEEGTAAGDMKERPSRRTAERRRDRLLRAQQDIVFRRANERVGEEDEILLDRPERWGDTSVWQGRSRRQAPEVDGVVWVRGLGAEAKAGDFVRVRYTARRAGDMEAEPLRRPGAGARS